MTLTGPSTPVPSQRRCRAPTARNGCLDVAERDDDVLIRAELPGIDPETVDITLDGQVLTIKGAKSLVTDGEQDGFRRREIYEGSFRRSIRLPFAVDPATVSASASNGILEIIVPRQEQPSAHKIAVTVV